ncbi:hypothetical protein [Persicobacter diffluens]|uniref:Uncharacterized protein n=1 Tax=Persicobacter diffluens TaxID=981 RepID=A0AAN4VW95_9BACT|nr:hypothetical protein PEDI_09610 [Persicobacter diffluens]
MKNSLLYIGLLMILLSSCDLFKESEPEVYKSVKYPVFLSVNPIVDGEEINIEKANLWLSITKFGNPVDTLSVRAAEIELSLSKGAYGFQIISEPNKGLSKAGFFTSEVQELIVQENEEVPAVELGLQTNHYELPVQYSSSVLAVYPDLKQRILFQGQSMELGITDSMAYIQKDLLDIHELVEIEVEAQVEGKQKYLSRPVHLSAIAEGKFLRLEDWFPLEHGFSDYSTLVFFNYYIADQGDGPGWNFLTPKDDLAFTKWEGEYLVEVIFGRSSSGLYYSYDYVDVLEVPRMIGNLSHLKELTMVDGPAGRNMCSAFYQLTELEVLRFWYGAFDLTEEVSNFKNLKKLEYRYLYYGDLVNPLNSGFAKCLKLESLEIESAGDLTFATTDFEHLQNLKKITFYESGLNFIPAWVLKIEGLESFNIIHNEISNISDLQKMTNLKRLYVQANKLSGDIPEWIWAKKDWEALGLGTNQWSKTLPDRFGDFTSLNLLSLSGVGFEGAIPASIGQCTALTYLNLERNNFSGKVPQEIVDLPNLKSLYLDEENKLESN